MAAPPGLPPAALGLLPPFAPTPLAEALPPPPPPPPPPPLLCLLGALGRGAAPPLPREAALPAGTPPMGAGGGGREELDPRLDEVARAVEVEAVEPACVCACV